MKRCNSHPLWDLMVVGIYTLVFSGLLVYLGGRFILGWWSA